MLSSYEMMELTGATYRQLDYWCAKELIGLVVKKEAGSGYYRKFDESEIPKVKLFVAISKTFGQAFPREVMKLIYDNFSEGSIKFDTGLILMWPSLTKES